MRLQWLAVGALSWALSGCGQVMDVGVTDGVWVRNSTDVTLHFAIIKADGKPFDLTDEVTPGETYELLHGSQLSSGAGLMVDRCTVGDLIAYDPSGREIARHPPGLCARTKDLWKIGRDALWVHNGTDVTLHFTIIKADGTALELSTVIAPGETGTLLSLTQPASLGALADGRTVGDLVAYDPNGRETARHRPPLCVKSQDHWAIGPPASAQPSG
jgi:hypothetical protein